MNEMIKLLQNAAEQKQVMAVYRDETGDSWSGIPVLTGPAIAVLARERDFALDGYLAIGADQISSVEQYDDNDFIRRVMKGEKVYESCKRPDGLQGCRDWKELLEGVIKGFSGWCIAECTDGEGELCFYVGRVLTLERDHLTLRPLDADGSWYKEAAVIPYEDLRTVCFGGNYLRVYKKYTSGGVPPRAKHPNPPHP